MDIQFVIDPYACVQYIVEYISKSESGISSLLKKTVESFNQSNPSIKEKLRCIVNKFINSNEISAQEACYLSLGFSVSKSSRSSIFINTAPPENRVHILKPKEQLNNLPSDSTDIFSSGLLDYYPLRPRELENVCLAKFAAYFTIASKKTSKNVVFF